MKTAILLLVALILTGCSTFEFGSVAYCKAKGDCSFQTWDRAAGPAPAPAQAASGAAK